jgi:tRNA pseudouridine(55) synthase
MFYLIDKPHGLSSFDVIRKLRKVLSVKRIWHAGTLDPFATGCLIIATGKSTKLLSLLTASWKEYVFDVDVDHISETLDTESVATRVSTELYIEKSDQEIIGFLEKQKTQTPPKYSAIHINWIRAYKLARKGRDFQIPERKIEIKNVEIISRWDHTFLIKVSVSSGTYIRSLGPLLGKFLGTNGGYLKSLERTKIITPYWSLSKEISSSVEHPVAIDECMVFPTIHTYILSDTEISNLKNGIPPYWISFTESWYVFFSDKSGDFLSLCMTKEDSISIIHNDVK